MKIGGLRILTTNDSSQGPPGPPGPPGQTGLPGTAATINVGSVNTLSPASPASVTNVGTTSNAIFNFGIPQGQTGAVGSLNPIGSTPNAQGATLSGNTLNLQPANNSFGGVITTGPQTFAGVKTFNGGILYPGGWGTNYASTHNATSTMTLDSGTINSGDLCDIYVQTINEKTMLTLGGGGSGLVGSATGTPTILNITGGTPLPSDSIPPNGVHFLVPMFNNGLITSGYLFLDSGGNISLRLLGGGNLIAPFGIGEGVPLYYSVTQ